MFLSIVLKIGRYCFFPDILDPPMGVFVAELQMVRLCLVLKDGNPVMLGAFLFGKLTFFTISRIVLMTRSAVEEPLSLTLE